MQDDDTHYYPATGRLWAGWAGVAVLGLAVAFFFNIALTLAVAFYGFLLLVLAFQIVRSPIGRSAAEWWAVHHPRGLDGFSVGPDGIVELLPGRPQVEHSWATVVSVTVDERATRVDLTDGEIRLQHRFDEVSRLMIAQDIRRRLRGRGAPDGGAEVDGARISRWLGVPEGEGLVCACPSDPDCAVMAWQDGLVVRRPTQRTHLGWSDLEDLELVPAERADPHGWRLVTTHGEFIFRADWTDAERLAGAIECALAEREVGHRLPGLVAGEVSDAAISWCESVEPGADRGISRV
ncbi:MAG: hypothetical protein HYU66_00335 [Armatimonadetes bacterium]|nr:hypothetical protein [Armatimonadota bacterium]